VCECIGEVLCVDADLDEDVQRLDHRAVHRHQAAVAYTSTQWGRNDVPCSMRLVIFFI
jgi:hypothetical protein